MRFKFETIDDPTMAFGAGEATFLVCDTCGEPVKGQQDANVVFLEDSDRNETGEIKVIHKQGCETPQTQRLRWQDLDLFLRDVVMNARMDLGETEARITADGGLADFGLHR